MSLAGDDPAQVAIGGGFDEVGEGVTGAFGVIKRPAGDVDDFGAGRGALGEFRAGHFVTGEADVDRLKRLAVIGREKAAEDQQPNDGSGLESPFAQTEPTTGDRRHAEKPIDPFRAGHDQEQRENQSMPRTAITAGRVQANQGQGAGDFDDRQQQPDPRLGTGRPRQGESDQTHDQQRRRRGVANRAGQGANGENVGGLGGLIGSKRAMRSTASAADLGAVPRRRWIAGLVPIPPLKAMNGPTIKAGPITKIPTAVRERGQFKRVARRMGIKARQATSAAGKSNPSGRLK